MMLLMMTNLSVLLSMAYEHPNATSGQQRLLNGCPAKAGEGSALCRHSSGPNPAVTPTINMAKLIVFDELERHLDVPNLKGSPGRLPGPPPPSLHQPSPQPPYSPPTPPFDDDLGTISSPTIAAPPPPAMAAVGAATRAHPCLVCA